MTSKISISEGNINSLRKKYEILHSIIIYKVDTFPYLGKEARLVFPSNLFLMDGFSLPTDLIEIKIMRDLNLMFGR